ncbi:MAG: cytochrome c [Longimicrobiales bacterium]
MRKILLGAMLLVLAACGDPATEDSRAYTKAPLEKPGLLVAGEPESAMGVDVTLEPGLKGSLPAEVERARGAGGSGGGEESASAGDVALAPGVTRAEYDRGEELFGGAGGCMACHGPNGTGSTLAPSLTDEEWLHITEPDVDAVAAVIRDGVADPQQYPAPMPPMGGASLSEDEVRALAAYVASIARN